MHSTCHKSGEGSILDLIALRKFDTAIIKNPKKIPSLSYML